jgi:hypothetical protein
MAKTNQPAGKASRNTDLPDSARDQERLKTEETTIDLPDVKDIPGQEFVHAPNPGEFADATISSADEEGDGVWDDDTTADESSNVSDLEKKLLDDSANDMPTKDEQQLRRAELDTTDNEGEPLNEKASANAISGSDLDTGDSSDEEAEDDLVGEEDEENRSYSLGGDDNSANEERDGV